MCRSVVKLPRAIVPGSGGLILQWTNLIAFWHKGPVFYNQLHDKGNCLSP